MVSGICPVKHRAASQSKSIFFYEICVLDVVERLLERVAPSAKSWTDIGRRHGGTERRVWVSAGQQFFLNAPSLGLLVI